MNISKQFLTKNKYSRPGTTLKATHVAWHYVGNPGSTAQSNRNYFENLKNTGKTYVSSHYVIGLEGEIIQCIPENEICYCTNNANSYAIAIECCHPDNTGKFTEATEQALVELTADILTRLGKDNNNIIRHYDVTGKCCPKYYVNHPEAYIAAKQKVADIMSGIVKSNSSSVNLSSQNIDIFYAVQCVGTSWYPEVKNTKDYAGDNKRPIVDIMMRVSAGNIKYRVHVKDGNWLPWVNGYDKNDDINGYAGNHQPIDAIEAYYNTPNNIKPKYVKYRVSNCGGVYYAWQTDNKKENGMDGYAGVFGKYIGKLQMKIE